MPSNGDDPPRWVRRRRRRVAAALIERNFRERIVLVGVTVPPASDDDTERVARRARAAGRHRGRRRRRPRHAAPRLRPTPAPIVGKGKAEEIRELSEDVDSDTVVFDDELTPAQQFNLEKHLRPHGDRPHRGDPRHLRPERVEPGGQGAGRAGAVALPAAPPSGQGHHVCRSSAAVGINTRGPGETQLEVDRRRIVRRIHKLEDDLTRRAQAPPDAVEGAPAHAPTATSPIVGYTNAGKSTLLNRLTDAGVLVEDRLFATLDATTRRLSLPGRRDGVRVRHRRLRAQAAAPTRRGVQVDARRRGRRRPARPRRRRVRRPIPRATSTPCASVLTEIGAGEVPELLVFNKADRQRRRRAAWPSAIPGRSRSRAVTGEGIDDVAARDRRPLARAHPGHRAAHPVRPRRRARGRAPRGPGARRAARGARHPRAAPGLERRRASARLARRSSIG